ncbi:unnamed protein product [Phytophthora fragariaefolia]|uniref:Unnamed protein product n=1 Tax=Phytophthora fragariaefolia TaxID=1490495 RepID=A0A9W6YGS9_9STRA|nr:unnamed protein product [Phytophthora fragariaefolia]
MCRTKRQETNQSIALTVSSFSNLRPFPDKPRMKFISQVLTTVALIATSVAALPDGIELSEVFGGPHGDKYSDLSIVKAGQIVKSITIRTGERVNGVGLQIADAQGVTTDLYHGGGGGNANTLTLGQGEHVIGIEAHWGEYHSHTRVRYIKFTTNANNTIEGGTKATKIGTDTASDGFQLGGFIGYAGKELDSVGAIWTKIDATGDSGSSEGSEEASGDVWRF